MRENRLLKTLRAGHVATGLVIPILSPDVVELCGHVGFDFAFIDCEHGPIGIQGCQDMVRAADAVGITPIVRIPKDTVHEINRYLDLGAQGVIVPHVNTAADAKRAVAEAQFSPRGHRGAASSSRAAGFGLPQDADTYFRDVNKEILVLPLI
ncbi:MAG: hypothetical protein HY660_07010, partial [Armatimonadetes bacterium]|nr:hypothetical protein [Armatimonadota bacterium]